MTVITNSVFLNSLRDHIQRPPDFGNGPEEINRSLWRGEVTLTEDPSEFDAHATQGIGSSNDFSLEHWQLDVPKSVFQGTYHGSGSGRVRCHPDFLSYSVMT
jgi:hypothetical protein